MMRLLAALLFVVAMPALALAQGPPNAWHPYRGATNCVQVADVSGNFNCSPLVTINPATGAFSLGGGAGFTAPNGMALVAAGTSYQLLGTGDLVIQTSERRVASTGPGMGGATLRVRRTAEGNCQLVVAGGNSFKEYVVAVIDPERPLYPLAAGSDGMLTKFSGGAEGC